MHNNEEKEFIFWLNNVKGIGQTKAHALINMFGSAKAVYNLSSTKLSSISFLTAETVNDMQKNRIDTTLEFIQKLHNLNIKVVTYIEKDYPFYLKEMRYPPLVLYYKGQLIDFEKEIPIGVIGARNCTSYGRECTFKISKELGINGAVVVSGLAKGIDTYSHKAAVENGFKTVAVVGCGLDICYPEENKALMEEICKNGCVFSEYPPGTKPLKHHFPARNRIIAGICRGILVVEARIKSGTFITVNFAADEGRDVFCLPGNITSSLSEGTNQLIREGATLITSGEEILIGYYSIDKKFKSVIKELPNLSKLSTDETILYLELKKYKEISLENIKLEHKFDYNTLIYILMTLELKGFIIKKPGNIYCVK
ncbi:MAG: DNA-processing protein DprA [Lachnospirales bacterium]